MDPADTTSDASIRIRVLTARPPSPPVSRPEGVRIGLTGETIPHMNSVACVPYLAVSGPLPRVGIEAVRQRGPA
jgi:hypothetical protein